jgi:hypothetical protein
MKFKLGKREYEIEERVQPDKSSILVRGKMVKESKYIRHQGSKEIARRLRKKEVAR